ncbi:MAG: DNA alkylation repair protein [Gordonia sp. (in: high G+C Gram-positive bacteria)]|uniref:DNA alkylation repair protein n=1 Tax=Gordonia sp. (in: high G+C Gram-positive bacteria) TaxID=84139 RepID=UPI0039E4167C
MTVPPLTAASSAAEIADTVRALGNPEEAEHAQRFFKTGPGEYGEGDVFAGVRVPVLRTVSKRLRELPLPVLDALLDDPVHEVRALALFTLAERFSARAADRAAVTDLYRRAVRRGRVNNWDLVDSSARPILGAWLVDAGDHRELLDWASSEDLWERRVGIIGTFAFIESGSADAILAVAPLVVDDRRDLIQKALGWMLREAGKRVDETVLTGYLEKNAARMGRTALSYAVERLAPEQRAYYRSR